MNRDEVLNREIDRLSEKSSLDSWTAYVRELDVPSDIFPAMASNRVELLALVQPRPLTADEHKVYLALICGLMETNNALREHAQQVAGLVASLEDGLKGAYRTSLRIQDFANFKHICERDDE